MHSKSDNMEIMINSNADKVVKELFESFKNRYQNNLEKRWKVVSLSLIMLLYSVIYVIKNI